MAVTLDAGFPRPFGPYVLLSSYGRGGMGEVFLAVRRHIEGIDQLCVLKTLRRDVSKDKSYVRRFLDEARVVVRMNHRNICSVFEVGQIGDEYFMAMEHIEGVNLRELLTVLSTRGEPLERPLALHIMSEVCEALSYAHALCEPMTGEPLKLVHRDVSPHNVMIGFDGRVKLIDFGLAESTLKQEHTESHIVLGKVAYMSPEQARGDNVDGTADQYSVAVMLYEALAGDRYFGDMTTPQIWAIAGIGGHVPRQFGALDNRDRGVLSRALSKIPADRFVSCADFRGAIMQLPGVQPDRVNRELLAKLMQRCFVDDVKRSEAISKGVSQHLFAMPSADSNTDHTISLHAQREDTLQLTQIVPKTSSPLPLQEAPRNRTGIVLAATALLVAIGAAGAVIMQRQEPQQIVIVAPPPSPPSPPSPPPPPVATPPPPPPVQQIEEPQIETIEKSEKVTARKKIDKKNETKVAEAKPPPPPPARPELTPQLAIAALKKCDRPCAKKMLPGLEKSGEINWETAKSGVEWCVYSECKTQ
jgi:eukaryotic-like serine/threonine-protein kinase